MNCIFCQIVSGEAPSKILYRDDLVTAFLDIHPIAQQHFLIVTNRHITSVNDLQPADEPLVGHMVLVAKELAAREGISENGYRLIMNTGVDAGQSVFHLHLHLIAGKFARFHLK